MGQRSSFAFAAALIIFPVMALAGYKHWLDTRIQAPLNMPVSLSRGYTRPNDFYINLKGQYLVELNVDDHYLYRADCQL